MTVGENVTEGIAVGVGVILEGGESVTVGESMTVGVEVLLGSDVGVALGSCSVGAGGGVACGSSTKTRDTARNIKAAATRPRTRAS